MRIGEYYSFSKDTVTGMVWACCIAALFRGINKFSSSQAGGASSVEEVPPQPQALKQSCPALLLETKNNCTLVSPSCGWVGAPAAQTLGQFQLDPCKHLPKNSSPSSQGCPAVLGSVFLQLIFLAFAPWFQKLARNSQGCSNDSAIRN